MSNNEISFFSGGLRGAEATFGECAEKYGILETTFSFAGHKLAREKNVVVLTDAELARGNVSMEIVAARMGRNYTNTESIRKVFQSIFHMINRGYQVFAVGWIRPDNTVKGGTGWGIELAKFFNRPLSVFDQTTDKWFVWNGGAWVEELPIISSKTFCGTGTRELSDAGRKAIEDLFARSFAHKH